MYSLTVGKKAYLALDSKEQETILKFQKESEKFTNRSLELMEDDRKNFMMLMDCFKLPKESDEEKDVRKKSIKENTIKAMETPLILARESLEFYENLNIMKKYGNKMLLSDLSIAAVLLHSAIESSIINVKVNLNSLRNEEFFEKIDLELKEISLKSQRQKQEIVDYVEEIIYS